MLFSIHNQTKPVPTDNNLFLLRIMSTFQELSMGSERPLLQLKAELSVSCMLYVDSLHVVCCHCFDYEDR